MDPADDLSDAEAHYHESSDEDFNPTALLADAPSSSDEDDEDASAKPARGKGKRKAAADEELDSGDEATIEAARKRKKKKRKGGTADEDELLLSDDGDEGGLVKTRAQRKVEQKARKPLARIDGATADVDALWTQMLAAPLKPVSASSIQATDTLGKRDGATKGAAIRAVEEEEQVTVKKVYKFAGQLTEEEKLVPRSALDAHLELGWKVIEPALEKQASESGEPAAKDDGPKVRRPLRRPSRFDSNPTGYVRALPPEHQLSWPRKATTKTTTAASAGVEIAPPPGAAKAGRSEKAHKLNVVDKSRLDWTGFVDKEGIGEELDTHGKTKEAYLGRMEFLAGVEARREEERKKAKIVAMAS